MAFIKTNGQVILNIKTVHLKNTFKITKTFDNETGKEKEIKVFLVKIPSSLIPMSENFCWINVSEYYCQMQELEWEAKTNNKSWKLTIDPLKKYSVYKNIQGDVKEIYQLSGESIIKYFIEQEQERKIYTSKFYIKND
ncbi:hypothetical protein EMELA_v1c02630 [Mesoplasma melaleucae]|uniref:Uncharacterized protein n=3 Tax=Mesoplasma melaleucae TaxID=81459 RepID=A0A2K8NWA7_9MOLU|nr:hypothetical protein [Mesoplasma melaleucae]ATZ17836.1 hypothetical protein EMELA_v1c02630 [Mesoplasma melaleucae]